MREEPNGIQGIINKLNGLSKVLKDKSIAETYA
jgi:hypothetical protein